MHGEACRARRAPAHVYRRTVSRLQQYISLTLYRKQTITPGVEEATRLLGLLGEANEAAAPRMANGLPPLEVADFYNVSGGSSSGGSSSGSSSSSFKHVVTLAVRTCHAAHAPRHLRCMHACASRRAPVRVMRAPLLPRGCLPRPPACLPSCLQEAVNNEDFNVKEDFRRWKNVSGAPTRCAGLHVPVPVHARARGHAC